MKDSAEAQILPQYKQAPELELRFIQDSSQITESYIPFLTPFLQAPTDFPLMAVQGGSFRKSARETTEQWLT